MQHVNLYQGEFRSQRDLTDALHLALGLLGILIALLAVSGYQAWQVRTAEQRLSAARAQQETVQARMDELRTELQEVQAGDTDAAGQLEELRLEYEAKRRLLRFLEQGPLADQAGFARHLEGLARRVVDGVWLERIRLERGGSRIRLDGHAQNARQIPDFMASLGRAPAYDGRKFRTLRVQREQDGGAIAFVLASDRVKLDSEGKR